MIKLMNNSSNNQPVVESLALYTKTLHDRLLFCSQLEFTSLKSEVSHGLDLGHKLALRRAQDLYNFKSSSTAKLVC